MIYDGTLSPFGNVYPSDPPVYVPVKLLNPDVTIPTTCCVNVLIASIVVTPFIIFTTSLYRNRKNMTSQRDKTLKH